MNNECIIEILISESTKVVGITYFYHIGAYIPNHDRSLVELVLVGETLFGKCTKSWTEHLGESNLVLLKR